MNPNTSYTSYAYPRTKAVQTWISSDPLRARWYGADCPNCSSHTLGFRLDRPNGGISRVECMSDLGGCGWVSYE